MLTCAKKFKNFPFAHRVHTHDGHCALIHGHNWDFEIGFTASHTDENGYVLDFGKMGEIKKFLEDKFDHTLVLSEGDPLIEIFQDHFGDCARIMIVRDCSAEGLARFVAEEVGHIVFSIAGRVVEVASVTVRENPNNSATYIPE